MQFPHVITWQWQEKSKDSGCTNLPVKIYDNSAMINTQVKKYFFVVADNNSS